MLVKNQYKKRLISLPVIWQQRVQLPAKMAVPAPGQAQFTTSSNVTRDQVLLAAASHLKRQLYNSMLYKEEASRQRRTVAMIILLVRLGKYQVGRV